MLAGDDDDSGRLNFQRSNQ